MTIKHIWKLFLLFLIFSCHQEKHLSKIEGKRIEINDSISSNPEIENFIKPYREHVNKNLDSVLTYAMDTYSKRDGNLNTAIGNLMADAVYEQGNPIFKKRTGNTIDFVLLNHGGIRAIISEGDVSTRTAYEVMPFENSVVVVALKGKQIIDMANYLARAKRAHPVSSQFNLVLNQKFQIVSVKINNEAIDENKIYHVATNDYLYNGGDRMYFFKPNEGLYILDYKIRNVLIDYFKQKDTLNPKIDERFIQIND